MERYAPALVAALATACAAILPGTPVEVSQPPAAVEGHGEFTSTGEVFYSIAGTGWSAAFDETAVRGPLVNLVRQGPDRWAGDIAGQPYVFHVEAGHIRSIGMNLHVRREGKALVVRGLVGERRIRFTVGPDTITGSTTSGRCALDLKHRPDGSYRGRLGCIGGLAGPTAEVRLEGAAANLQEPTFPQAALALVSILP